MWAHPQGLGSKEGNWRWRSFNKSSHISELANGWAAWQRWWALAVWSPRCSRPSRSGTIRRSSLMSSTGVARCHSEIASHGHTYRFHSPEISNHIFSVFDWYFPRSLASFWVFCGVFFHWRVSLVLSSLPASPLALSMFGSQQFRCPFIHDHWPS